MYLDNRKTIGIAATCLASALVSSAIWQLANPETRDCVMRDSGNSLEIRARKVVVQPWLGRHHVYGIFIVPKRYGDANEYLPTMRIQGLEVSFVVEEGGERVQDTDLLVEEDYYPKQVFISTRTALWLMVSGQFGYLRNPCSWVLKLGEKIHD
jgi:hypothetical protein